MIRLELTLDKIDYNAVIDLLLPQLASRMSESDDPKLQTLAKLPPSIAATALKSLSYEKKEELAVFLLDHYRQSLTDNVEKMAAEQGISLRVTDSAVHRA